MPGLRFGAVKTTGVSVRSRAKFWGKLVANSKFKREAISIIYTGKGIITIEAGKLQYYHL